MSTPLNSPEQQFSNSKRRRSVIGLVAAAAVTGIAAPVAMATIFSVNELASSFALTDCLSKNVSADATGPGAASDDFYINFDNAATNTGAGAGTTLQETLTVRVPAGHVTTAQDVFTIDVASGCSTNFTATFEAAATNSFGQNRVESFEGQDVKFYAVKRSEPANPENGIIAPGNLVLSVDATGTVTTPAGPPTFTVEPGNKIQVAVVVYGGKDAETGQSNDDLDQFRYQVHFEPTS